MKLIYELVLAPKTGLAHEIMKGQHLRITDLEGQQVVDFAVFNLDNPREKLSTSYSRSRRLDNKGGEYEPRDHVQEGDTLLSTLCRPMMTIVKETPEPKGVHDVHHRMCSREFYESHGLPPRDGCFEIISGVVAPYGILPEDLPDTLDIFENHYHDVARRRWILKAPITKPGDYIEFRAEMNCLAAMSNCPDDVLSDANAGHCTPIKIEVFAAA